MKLTEADIGKYYLVQSWRSQLVLAKLIKVYNSYDYQPYLMQYHKGGYEVWYSALNIEREVTDAELVLELLE